MQLISVPGRTSSQLPHVSFPSCPLLKQSVQKSDLKSKAVSSGFLLGGSDASERWSLSGKIPPRRCWIRGSDAGRRRGFAQALQGFIVPALWMSAILVGRERTRHQSLGLSSEPLEAGTVDARPIRQVCNGVSYVIQNATVMLATMLSSSSTMSAPRISGGKISEIFRGAIMLNIPFPMPPTSLPIANMDMFIDTVCMTDPTTKMMTATTMKYFLEILSATQP